MSASMFGWDLIYRLAENDINKKEDVLLVLVHWFLVKSGLKCVGLGDDKTVPVDDEGSEALPDGWNKEPVYALRYMYKQKLYILHGTKSEDDIIFNLMRASDMVVSNVTFNVEDTVKQLKGPLNKTIPSYSNALDNIKKDLVEPVFSGKQRAVSTQTIEDPPTGPDVLPPRRFTDDHIRPRRPDPEVGRWDPYRNPLSINWPVTNSISLVDEMYSYPFGSSSGFNPQPFWNRFNTLMSIGWPNMDLFPIFDGMAFNSSGFSSGYYHQSQNRNFHSQLPIGWPANGSSFEEDRPLLELFGYEVGLNHRSLNSWNPLRDPLAVGRSDLDPFSRGGGMIFDPFGPRDLFPGGPGPDTSGVPGGLPRGSVPPGARFDPVGPPLGGIGRGPSRGPGRGQPDHDHLPPPGYDDMFM